MSRSIVIPSLHQKFSLRSSEEEREKGTVVRRNACILLLSRTRTKAMVLQFRSLQDCLDFSDRFIALNPLDENQESPSMEDTVMLEADRETVAAHLIRLVHDTSFEMLVRNVESSLENTPDGNRILQSWVERDFDASLE